MQSANEDPRSPLQSGAARWIENARVQAGITALIVLNAIILGLETDAGIMEAYGPLLLGLDKIILAVFVVEILLRLFVHRLAFFRDAWSLFDFVVVGIALVPASGPFAVLRALRVLRVLRILTLVPSMRRGLAELDTRVDVDRGRVAADLLRICRDRHQPVQ